jgi:uncharacterized protein (DUF1501 family)
MTTSRLSRRSFLQGIGAALAVAPAARFLAPGLAGAVNLGPTLPAGTPVLVLVELAGGNDILNTVVPHSVSGVTSFYRDARPNLAIENLISTRPYGPPASGNDLPPALALDDGWGLHGALPWLANRWHDVGDVAIVKGSGENVLRDMSHFASYAFRWAGAFGGDLMNTGWLGRFNDRANDNQPLGAVSLTGAHQALASLRSPSVAISDLDTFDFRVDDVPSRDAWFTALHAMGGATSSAPNKVAVATKALELARSASERAQGVPRLAGAGSSGSLASQMTTAASLIAAGIPCQTYVATLGSFDTHGSEAWNHKDRLGELNAGLAHLFELLAPTSRAQDVVVMIHSEFGRQIIENAGAGTDHGLATDTIVVGGGVEGGWYGQTPDLAPNARHADAMVPTVDFRSVYATILNRLGGDPNLTEDALGHDESGTEFADLGFFTGASAPAMIAPGPPPVPDTPADLQPHLEAPELTSA